jgi:hypothetical protein
MILFVLNYFSRTRGPELRGSALVCAGVARRILNVFIDGDIGVGPQGFSRDNARAVRESCPNICKLSLGQTIREIKRFSLDKIAFAIESVNVPSRREAICDLVVRDAIRKDAIVLVSDVHMAHGREHFAERVVFNIVGFNMHARLSRRGIILVRSRHSKRGPIGGHSSTRQSHRQN